MANTRDSAALTSILRIPSISFMTNGDPVYHGFAVIVWTRIEMGVSIICACLPCLKVPLAKWFPNAWGTVTGDSKDDSNDSYTFIDFWQSKASKGSKSRGRVWKSRGKVRGGGRVRLSSVPGSPTEPNQWCFADDIELAAAVSPPTSPGVPFSANQTSPLPPEDRDLGIRVTTVTRLYHSSLKRPCQPSQNVQPPERAARV